MALDHDGGPAAPAPTRVVGEWPVGGFLENLAVEADGRILVTVHSDRAIDRCDPTSGDITRLAVAPAPLAGLAIGRDGTVWASGGFPGSSPGSIWRLQPGLEPRLWCELQDAAFLNGMAWARDGALLVADSVAGCVFRVLTSSPATSVWLAHDLLRPATPGGAPGANGIKLFGGAAIISNTDRNLLLRAPIGPDGRAGPPTVLAEHLRADDFAVGADGSLFIATHPANSVVRLYPDGSRATLAGVEDGVVNPTAVCFGGPTDPGAIYVTTTGGVLAPPPDGPRPARLLRIEVDVWEALA